MSKVKLKNISKLINSGLTPLRSNPDFWVNGNIPWLKTEQLGEKYIYDTNEKITKEAINKTSIKINPVNTISIAMYGEGRTRGNVSILKKEMTTNQACCNIVLDEEKASYEYIYYFLKTKYEKLRSLSSGVRKNLNSDDIKNFEVVLPEKLEDQQKIASVLSTLDAKIELNNKINTELEAMAKTLYDYWFVQFDFPCLPENYKFSGASKPANFESVLTYTQVGGLPLPDGKKWFVYVILCEDGSFYKGITNDLYRRYYEHKTGQGADWTKSHKPKKIIHYEEFKTQKEAAKREKELKTGFGRTWLQREYKKFLALKENRGGLPAPKFACKLRMAGEMVWSKELKRDLPARSTQAGIPKGWEVKKVSDLLPVITGKQDANFATENGKYNFFTCGEEILKCDSYEFEGKAVLIAGNGNFGIKLYEGKFNAYQRTYILIPNNEKHYTVIYLAVKDKIQSFKNSSRGSIIKFITKGDIEDIQIPLPKDQSLDVFSELNTITKKIEKNILENQKLAQLRDFLLPMLMNGQVVVE